MILSTIRGRLTLLAALSMFALFGAQADAQRPRFVEGEVLVGVADDQHPATTIPMLERNVGVVAGHHPGLQTYRLRLHNGVSIASAIARLRRQHGVLFAEPNFIRHTCATPNDPNFSSNQYSPQLVNATGAWSIWAPQRQVIIAIVDTGVMNAHEDLTNKILRDQAGIVGYNAFTGVRSDANDDYGHGTHCAGIAAAQVNNGKGIAGIAGWDGSANSDTSFVKIMPVKVLDSSGSGSDATVASGVTWAADHGANVISMSLGESDYSYTLDSAVQYAYSKGCVVVAAAGNNGSDSPFFPAANANVISVAATNSSDGITAFSNYGSWVTVAAPGENIYSTYYNGSYVYSTGTSMACPHVAGEAALLLAQNATLTNDQASYLIRNNVNAYSTSNHYIAPNSGRINVGTALANIGSVPASNPGSAAFVKQDTTTQGNWKGVYGSQGYDVFSDIRSLPDTIKVAATGELPYVWDANPTVTTALQRGSGTGRIAACSYNAGLEIRDVNLTDGQTHQVSLYCLDYDPWYRTQTVDVLDADSNTVLSTQTLSNMQNGVYLVWKIKGHVKFRLTNTGPQNAVFSGLFFDAQGGNTGGGTSTNSASYVKTDTSTSGSWKGVYGTAGYNIINNAASYPAYASVSSSGNSNYTWAASTTDTQALQKAGTATDRIAACWYSGSNFVVDVNLTDGQTHQVSLYCLDYDAYNNWHRAQTIDVLDADTGAVLSTQSVGNMQNGVYVVWNIKGHVKFRLTNIVAGNGPNAVLSGIFFDTSGSPRVPPTATFLKTDTSTSGSWKGVYGTAGYNIINNAASYPAYASVSSSGNSNYTWAASTTDTQALQKAGTATDRIAACWYSGSNFVVDVNLTDGQTHQVSLYCLDYDAYNNWHRAQTIDVLDADTGAVLSTQSVGNMQNGVYVVWNIKGHVKFRLTNIVAGNGPNAVLSGLFFD